MRNSGILATAGVVVALLAGCGLPTPTPTPTPTVTESITPAPTPSEAALAAPDPALDLGCADLLTSGELDAVLGRGVELVGDAALVGGDDLAERQLGVTHCEWEIPGVSGWAYADVLILPDGAAAYDTFAGWYEVNTMSGAQDRFGDDSRDLCIDIGCFAEILVEGFWIGAILARESDRGAALEYGDEAAALFATLSDRVRESAATASPVVPVAAEAFRPEPGWCPSGSVLARYADALEATRINAVGGDGPGAIVTAISTNAGVQDCTFDVQRGDDYSFGHSWVTPGAAWAVDALAGEPGPYGTRWVRTSASEVDGGSILVARGEEGVAMLVPVAGSALEVRLGVEPPVAIADVAAGLAAAVLAARRPAG